MVLEYSNSKLIIVSLYVDVGGFLYVRFEISARNAHRYVRDIFSEVLRHDLRLSVSCISRDRRRNALYIWIHSIYDLLSIATAGVPLAVSKFVSKYNALGDYKTSRRMFRSGMVMMIVTGVLSFLVLYMTAPLFAEAMLGKQSVHSNIGEVTTIIRLVSFALIVVPAASLIRGYFQGHQSMG